MEIPSLIISRLTAHGTAPVQGFGTFFLKKTGASYSPETDTLLPPAQQIFFSPDYDLADATLINTMPEAHAASDISSELARQTAYWKNKLNAAEPFEIAGLGKFLFSDNEMHFYGEKISFETPDFYGLEEIPISNLKKNSKKSGYFWPAALSLIAIAAIGAVSYLNPELLFGSASFPKKTQPQKIVAKKKPDSLQRAQQQNILKDTTQAAKPAAHKQKIYRKKLWRKARRHWNH